MTTKNIFMALAMIVALGAVTLVGITFRNSSRPPSTVQPATTQPNAFANANDQKIATAPPSGVVKPGEYRSDLLKIAFTYPPNWTVDESSVSQGFVSVQSTPVLDINAKAVTGKLEINTVWENPDKLSPTVWFTKYIAPEVEPPESQREEAVSTYRAYNVVIRELQKRAHVYLLSGTRVVEVVYPVDQPQFQQTYEDILNSLRVE